MSVAEPLASPAPLLRRFPLPTGPLLGLIAVLALFSVLIGTQGGLAKFWRLPNLQILAHEAAIPAVLALGMLLVIISGGIDLSIGSVVALVTVVTMQTYRACYAGPETVPTASLIAVVAGVATGGLCGLVNGLIVTQLRIPPFVATLGMFGVARGLAIWLASRTLVAFPRDGRPEWVDTLATVHPTVGVFNPGVWSVLLLAVLIAVLLNATVLGRYVYAVGSSEATARLCGVSVARTKLAVYTIAGLLTGWGGVLMFAHGGSGNPSAGEGLELVVIAAVVIGGASLGGGQGTVLGAMLGVLILGVVDNGVNLFNVPVEMQHILIGVVLVANVALSARQKRAGD